MTAQSERERDGFRKEDWRREREIEKMRDKARYKDIDPREGHYERDRAPAPLPRERERERERDSRQEDDRSRNGRPLSNVEKEAEREVERGMKKGDTFPRMRKSIADHGRRMTATTEMDEERGERRQRERARKVETDDWERERERAWQTERHRIRERDEIRIRAKEEGQNTGRRPIEDKKSRQRERYQQFDVGFQDKRREIDNSWGRREGDATRKREKPRPEMGKRETRVPSPHRRRDREIYSDRAETEKAQRREGWRDTRSESDSDEREMRMDREKEELQDHHSRSEGDNRGQAKKERDRHRQVYREEDRQTDRDRHREREVDRSRRRGVEKDRERHREVHRTAAREADRKGERCKESVRDVKDDRRDYDRYREYKQGRGRETKGREADPRWDDSTGRGSRSLNETAARVPPRAQSSGEWSTTESDREVDEQRNPEGAAKRSQVEQKRSERPGRDGGETSGGVPEQRRMWLEPRRGKNSKEDFVDRERDSRKRNIESQAEWEREGQRVKEEPDESYLEQSSYRGRHGGRNEYKEDTERETGGVSVDGEEVGEVWRKIDKGGKEHMSDSNGGIEGNRWRDAMGENMTDNTEESEREEEGGSNYSARSESEGGSETGWKQERDRMLSGEDGFVTLSSGGDEEDDREEDEEEFKDCQDFWEGGVAYDDPSPGAFKEHEGDEERQEEWTMRKDAVVDEDDQGKEKQTKHILVGQTLH